MGTVVCSSFHVSLGLECIILLFRCLPLFSKAEERDETGKHIVGPCVLLRHVSEEKAENSRELNTVLMDGV